MKRKYIRVKTCALMKKRITMISSFRTKLKFSPNKFSNHNFTKNIHTFKKLLQAQTKK